MDSQKKQEIYRRALSAFGIESQAYMLVEECGELLNALAKLRRKRVQVKDVITELADVSIMCEQLGFYFDIRMFKMEKDKKLERLKERIEKHEHGEQHAVG